MRFTEAPQKSFEIATPIQFKWSGDDPALEFRYRLETPNNVAAIVRGSVEKWSEWGEWKERYYLGFAVEGDYVFQVQARRPGGRRVQSAAYRFRQEFVMPDLKVVVPRIDWKRVRKADDLKDRYKSLAAQYRWAHGTWLSRYETAAGKLPLGVPADRFMKQLKKAVDQRNRMRLLSFADGETSASLMDVLTPEILYDIVRRVGIDAAATYRNAETNRAAFSAASAYWAWKGYQSLAAEADFLIHPQGCRVGRFTVDMTVNEIPPALTPYRGWKVECEPPGFDDGPVLGRCKTANERGEIQLAFRYREDEIVRLLQVESPVFKLPNGLNVNRPVEDLLSISEGDFVREAVNDGQVQPAHIWLVDYPNLRFYVGGPGRLDDLNPTYRSLWLGAAGQVPLRDFSRAMPGYRITAIQMACAR